MIIRINSLESTIEIFYERYVKLHGFLKLESESEEKRYIIIIQLVSTQTIQDYVLTRQKLRNVRLTDYIQAELESELEYVSQGKPIICSVIDRNTGEREDQTLNVFFTIEDLMEHEIIKPHSLHISEDQSDKADYLRAVFDPDGIYMGVLAAENQVDVFFPIGYLMYHMFIAGATGQGKSNLNQVFIDGLFQHNAKVILGESTQKVSMMAIDVHDEYARGCRERGVYDIAEAVGYNEELIGEWFYLYPHNTVAPPELNRVARSCVINYQEIIPQDLLSTGTFNELQASALYAAYNHNREGYINLLLHGTDEEIAAIPGRHHEATFPALRRRLYWLVNSHMFQDGGNSRLPEVITRLENGSVILFNVSLISEKEQFLFNSVLARTLFEIRKALKSSNDLNTFHDRLDESIPEGFLNNFIQGSNTNRHGILPNIYMKTNNQLKRPEEMPIILFTIEEAPTILRSEIMKNSEVFRDISRQGRKFNLGLQVISQQYTPIDDTIISNMNTVINLPLRSEKEKSAAGGTIGGGVKSYDIESLTGTRGIALIAGIWLTTFQKLRIPLYDDHFNRYTRAEFERFAQEMRQKNRGPPTTDLP
ncbi:MAG: ATP-binding protein [Promethearchaeota archaeon]